MHYDRRSFGSCVKGARCVARCSAVFALFLAGLAAARADLPSPAEVVAQAGKACEEMGTPAKAGRQRDLQAKFERELRQRAYSRLAQARVHLGDFEGAIEALNRVNSDPQFSAISVQAMRTELTGVVAPWPDGLPARLRELQRGVLTDILARRGSSMLRSTWRRKSPTSGFARG